MYYLLIILTGKKLLILLYLTDVDKKEINKLYITIFILIFLKYYNVECLKGFLIFKKIN